MVEHKNLFISSCYLAASFSLVLRRETVWLWMAYARALVGVSEYADFLGAGYAGVDEVALEHDEVFHRHGHDHHRKFRALALVDCHGVGQRQFIEFRHIVFYEPPVIYNGQGALRGIHGVDISDVAIEHVLVVVVADPHHLVASPKRVAAACQRLPEGLRAFCGSVFRFPASTLPRRIGGQYLYLLGIAAVGA